MSKMAGSSAGSLTESEDRLAASGAVVRGRFAAGLMATTAYREPCRHATGARMFITKL
jgi:hypothetical protein